MQDPFRPAPFSGTPYLCELLVFRAEVIRRSSFKQKRSALRSGLLAGALKIVEERGPALMFAPHWWFGEWKLGATLMCRRTFLVERWPRSFPCLSSRRESRRRCYVVFRKNAPEGVAFGRAEASRGSR